MLHMLLSMVLRLGYYVFYKDFMEYGDIIPVSNDAYYYKIFKIIKKEDVETIEKDFYIII